MRRPDPKRKLHLRCQACGARFEAFKTAGRRYCSHRCANRAVSAQYRQRWPALIAVILPGYLAGRSLYSLAPSVNMTAASLNTLCYAWRQAGLLPPRARLQPKQNTVGHAPCSSPFDERISWPTGIRFEDARVSRLPIRRLALGSDRPARSSMGYE